MGGVETRQGKSAMAPEPLVLQGVRGVGEEGWFGEKQRRWLGNCCEERAHVEFGVYCRCGGLGQIIDVITAIKPSFGRERA